MISKVINPNWHLLPCYSINQSSKKCSCKRGGCSPGKHPHHMVRRGVLDATNNWDQIREWMHKDPFLNLAVRTGEESGIWVLDIDHRDIHLIKKNTVYRRIPDFGTLMVETPRGFHYYFKWPKAPHKRYQDIRNRVNVFENVDVRGANGYTILPNNHNGYRYLNHLNPIDAPNWLLERVLSK